MRVCMRACVRARARACARACLPAAFVRRFVQTMVNLKKGKFDVDIELVLFCAGGFRSELAAKSLKDMGFKKVSHIDGGFGALKQSKFKIV